MATNESFRDADHLALPVPSGTKAGDPLRIGGLNVVAQTNRAKTDVSPTNADGTKNTDYDYGGGNVTGEASCWLKGAHVFTVAFAVTAVGDPIYITAGNALTTTAGGNSLYGHALNSKSAPSGPLTVRITN